MATMPVDPAYRNADLEWQYGSDQAVIITETFHGTDGNAKDCDSPPTVEFWSMDANSGLSLIGTIGTGGVMTMEKVGTETGFYSLRFVPHYGTAGFPEGEYLLILRIRAVMEGLNIHKTIRARQRNGTMHQAVWGSPTNRVVTSTPGDANIENILTRIVMIQDNPDPFKADISGLPTKEEMDKVKALVQNACDQIEALRDWGAARQLVENFDLAEDWVSSDPDNLGVLIDRNHVYYGGTALRLIYNAADDGTLGDGDTVLKTMPTEKPHNLSTGSKLYLGLLTEGYGQFVDLELFSSVNDTWYTIPLTVTAAQEGKWHTQELDISSIPIANRASITQMRFKAHGFPDGKNIGKSPLWPNWVEGIYRIWVDRLELQRTLSGSAGSDWA